VARVKALMLGIDGLSYKFFMKCSASTLLTLLDTVFRGVVENRDLHHPAAAWASALSGRPVKLTGFLQEVPSLPILEEVRGVLINVPLTDPTAGLVRIRMDQSTGLEAEIGSVREAALEALEEGPAIVGLTALERLKSYDVCSAYKAIDKLVRDLVNAADNFILFSPYGHPLQQGSGFDPYGVYLATVPRPKEHETVKVWEIGELFRKIINKI